jgi:high-affinity iron transporter
MLDYVGVDYPATVRDGQVIDTEEYQEQMEFSTHIITAIAALPSSPAQSELAAAAVRLDTLIRTRATGDEVSALATAMRTHIIDTYGVVVIPQQVPDLQQAAVLFHNQCSSCHGTQGQGDGPAAAALEPRPSNFHDTTRQFQRSLYGLYNTITRGVEGTAMRAFTELSDMQRWGLAFYVGSLPFTDSQRHQGEERWEQQTPFGVHTLKALTTRTAVQVMAEEGEVGLATFAYLRQHPEALAKHNETPMQFSARKLQESLDRYRQGDPKVAYELSVSAYLEGFELAETGLDAVDPALRRRIEQAMLALRTMIKQHRPVQEVETGVRQVQDLLSTAADRLQSTSLSPTMSFTSGFIILLREGLEAILVLAAIAAFLSKTGRRDATPYLHAGWIVALLLGGVTWVAASYFITISGAGRELTEGLTALLAAVILFYVGLWLHNKIHIHHWQQFIESKVRTALTGRTLWALALVSFIAVYREVFETVLFYQTLLAQAGPSGSHLVIAGFALAAVTLLVLAWLIFRFSVRLPIRLFFGVNAALMFILAVVFAGNGIAALQEAGKLPVHPVNFPRIDLLGIHPNLEALGLQVVLIAVTLVRIWWNKRRLKEEKVLTRA